MRVEYMDFTSNAVTDAHAVARVTVPDARHWPQLATPGIKCLPKTVTDKDPDDGTFPVITLLGIRATTDSKAEREH